MTCLSISLVLYQTSDDELSKLLDSLSLQSNKDFELFILDNSPEPRNIQTYNFKINYYKSAINLGFGRGHNANFKRANSKYFLVINPDIYFDDTTLLNSLINRMEQNQSIGLSSVRILNPDGSLQEVHRLLPRFSDICRRFFFNKLGIYYPYKHTYTLNHIDKTQDFKCPNISGCFMMFNSEVYKQAAGFDEQLFLYFEDIDLSRRCYFLTNGENHVFGNLVVYHTWKRQGYRSLFTFKVHVLSAVYYFQKYGVFRDKYSKTVNQKFENLSCK